MILESAGETVRHVEPLLDSGAAVGVRGPQLLLSSNQVFAQLVVEQEKLIAGTPLGQESDEAEGGEDHHEGGEQRAGETTVSADPLALLLDDLVE